MAKQKEDDKEEVTDLNTVCSKSTAEAENLEVLGAGGHQTTEGESSRLLPSESSWMDQDGSHTVTCTLTISLAVPALPAVSLGQKKKKSNPNTQGKRIQVDKPGARTQCYYHIEYFLLPDDHVPRKQDLVVFGVVAKLFTESDSKALTPWHENDKMWISWNHSVDVSVTNEYLIKLKDHKVILKIWDTKDKVSSKAKLSTPGTVSSLRRGAEAVDGVKHTVLLQRKLFEDSEPAPSCTKIKAAKASKAQESSAPPVEGRRGSGPKRNIDDAMAKKNGIASLQLELMPLLSGEKSVIGRLAENNPKILDAYVTFTVETPLLSERQKRELNPLVIKIKSATCLPNTPVPIEVLQRLCVPTYCKYKFHNFPPHQTHGQVHGTHVYFKDLNILLTGLMKPGELQRCLRGPPLEIEVHDRDRNLENNTKKPRLSREDEGDEKVGKVSLSACKSTISNSSTKKEVWHPHGVAKVSLTDLLLGKKYLTISAPIHSCSAPNTAAFSEEDKRKKKTESMSSSSRLPMGHYLESGSLLKVRVEIAVPLGTHAPGTADAEVDNCPYGYLIYIFDYNNSSLSYDLVEEITEINAKTLQLDCCPVPLIGTALAALKLKTTLEKVSEMDIVTGFHLLDGATHLFVLEGLKDKAIKRLWDRHFERTYRHEDGRVEVLYNSQLSFHQRLYADLEAVFYHFRLRQPLSAVTKQPLLYVRGRVPRACFQALSRLSYLCHSRRLRDVIRGDLLPSAEMITVLSREYGVPLTEEDLFLQKPPLLSLSSENYTVPGKVNRVKKAVYSSLDNYNEIYVQCKKEMAAKKSFQRNHIRANIGAVCQLKGKVKKPKFEAFRISPVDGKSVFNYSSQSLNSAELAKKHLRQEMAKEPKKRFTYCHEYLSAIFDPVDVVAACKELFEKSKSMWLSPDGFVFPGFKSSIESNLHPCMPDEARLEELSEKWQENALHGNREPVLSRDRWSWDKRHIDFDLYKKPPELFRTTAPQPAWCWPRENAARTLQTTFGDTKLKAHWCSTAAESPTRGPGARFQLQKLQGLLKDEPPKFSLRKAGPGLKTGPALASQPRATGSDALPGRKNIASGFVPDPDDEHSVKWRKNVTPWHNREHGKAEKLQGADSKQTELQEQEDAPPSSPTRTLSRITD